MEGASITNIPYMCGLYVNLGYKYFKQLMISAWGGAAEIWGAIKVFFMEGMTRENIRRLIGQIFDGAGPEGQSLITQWKNEILELIKAYPITITITGLEKCVGLTRGLWDLLVDEFDINNLITYTKPYVSVYNYDYNNYAIDDIKFNEEIKLKTILEPINSVGNKNRFPVKHVEQFLIPFISKQTVRANEIQESDPERIKKKNDIGCGIYNDQVILRQDFVSNICKVEIDKYKAKKIYRDGGLQLGKELEITPGVTRVPVNIPNNFDYDINGPNGSNIEIIEIVKTNMRNLKPLLPQYKKGNADKAGEDTEHKYRFLHILQLMKVVRCGAIYNNCQFKLHPHYVKYTENGNARYQYFLPVVYPSTDNIMFGFCDFLTKHNCKYLLMNSYDNEKIHENFEAGTILSYPITAEDNAYPICIIISPTHTEGFSFIYNPALFAPALCNTYGDTEQVYGRILRKYGMSAGNTPEKKRYDKQLYQYFGGSKSDLDNLNQYQTLYQSAAGEFHIFSSGYELKNNLNGKSNKGASKRDANKELMKYRRDFTKVTENAVENLLSDNMLSLVAESNISVKGQGQAASRSTIPLEQIQSYVKDVRQVVFREEFHLKLISLVSDMCNKYFKGLIAKEEESHTTDNTIMPMDNDKELIIQKPQNYMYLRTHPLNCILISDYTNMVYPPAKKLQPFSAVFKEFGLGGKSKRKRTLFKMNKTKQNKVVKSRRMRKVRNHKRTIKR